MLKYPRGIIDLCIVWLKLILSKSEVLDYLTGLSQSGHFIPVVIVIEQGWTHDKVQSTDYQAEYFMLTILEKRMLIFFSAIFEHGRKKNLEIWTAILTQSGHENEVNIKERGFEKLRDRDRLYCLESLDQSIPETYIATFLFR